MLNAEQIQKNWDKHLKIINHYITGDRKDKVLKMLETLSEIYIMAPASGKAWFHNAFAGGYVDHVNRVVQYSIKQHNLYKEMGGTTDYSEEQLVFAALFHDLGKLGDGEQPNYLPQTDKWRQDKLSEKYKNNPNIDFMLIQDRSLYILQKFGIKCDQQEFIAIRIHDGVFDKANEAYFFSHQESSRQKTNMVSVLHTGDFLASKVEYDLWKKTQNNTSSKPQNVKTSTGRPVKSSEGLTNLLKNI